MIVLFCREAAAECSAGNVGILALKKLQLAAIRRVPLGMGVPVRGRWIIIGAVLFAGCSRSWYHKQADRDAYAIIPQHIATPADDIGRFDITPPPQSRLSDPYNLDAPPKPPDDPSAAFFMARPGGIRGYSHWDKFGHLDQIETPNWEAGLGLDDRGVLRLTQDRAVEVALLDSQDFQTALETLYQQALALSLNRFDFDCQWFGTAAVDYLHTGGESPSLSTNLLTEGNSLGFTQNLAAGGQLMVNLANNFVWEFTGHTYSVTGGLGVSLMQPLLRGIGRNVRLETLTQGERNMLYAVRDFARFRKQFWANVAINPNGYLDLLLQVQAIRNAKANLKSNEENYRLNIELYRGNKRSVVEVDQALQGLLAARQQVLDAEIGLQNSLDLFKRRLGIPPRIPVELDETALEPFVLTGAKMQALRDDLEKFDLARKAELDVLPEAASLRQNFDELAKLVERAAAEIPSVEADLAKWKAILDRPGAVESDPESRQRAIETYQQNANVPAEAKKELAALGQRIAADKAAVTPEARQAGWAALTSDVKRLFSALDDINNAQALSRIYRIELPLVDANENESIAFAKENRLDLQNAKARVTDAWRQVDVAANALKGDLNVTAGATFATLPQAKNPFAFSTEANIYNVGVQFDGPLNRMAERNVYRNAQIIYEQARRSYMSLSDDIELQIRTDLRTLQQSRVSFEIARLQLIAAARSLENERILLVAPVPPRGGNTGDAALRTLAALTALDAARDKLAQTFIHFEQQRIQFLLDLEGLQLDERGFPSNATPRYHPAPDLPAP